MRALIRSALAVLTLVAAAAGGQAADIDVLPSEPAFTWTGAYVGAFVGGASSSGYSTSDAICQFGGFFCPGGASGNNQLHYQGAGSLPAQYDLGQSLIGGLTTGINWQVGKIVFGLEGEVGSFDLSGSGQFLTNGRFPCNPATPLLPPCSNYSAFSKFGDWYAVAAARIGVTADAVIPQWSDGRRALLYLKGGPAVARFSTGVSSSNFPGASFGLIDFSNTETVWGVALGGGLEWALSNNWSVKFEYERLNFDRTVQACGPLLTATGMVGVPVSEFCTGTATHGIDTVKAGISYRFSDRLWSF